jgi:hypothetical protein
VESLPAFLSGVQSRVTEAGCLSISLLQDQDDRTRVFEIEVWRTADDHKRFVRSAISSGTFKPLDGILNYSLLKYFRIIPSPLCHFKSSNNVILLFAAKSFRDFYTEHLIRMKLMGIRHRQLSPLCDPRTRVHKDLNFLSVKLGVGFKNTFPGLTIRNPLKDPRYRDTGPFYHWLPTADPGVKFDSI